MQSTPVGTGMLCASCVGRKKIALELQSATHALKVLLSSKAESNIFTERFEVTPKWDNPYMYMYCQVMQFTTMA